MAGAAALTGRGLLADFSLALEISDRPMEINETAKVPMNNPKRILDWVLALNDDSRNHTPTRLDINEAMMVLNNSAINNLISRPKIEKVASSFSSSGLKFLIWVGISAPAVIPDDFLGAAFFTGFFAAGGAFFAAAPPPAALAFLASILPAGCWSSGKLELAKTLFSCAAPVSGSISSRMTLTLVTVEIFSSALASWIA